MAISVQTRGFGVLANRETAEIALTELKKSGFPMEKISIIAKDLETGDRVGGAKATHSVGEQNVNSPTAVVSDLATGSTWGTLLVGLSGLALPGIGPILAAGSLGVALLTTLGGVAIGTVANANLVTSLVDLGIPEEQARVYSDRLLAGNYFLIVDGTEAEINQAQGILSKQDIEDWGIYPPSNGRSLENH
ncbi:hypothetical protein ACE1B6_21605 [Aerosakkonemataceae cyanobacterium BLCC-F154]|uniref:General stress protein 17M-like domain-containing protein n=1 Tax=Floridaenema fluviatile BLCC-F154 TaxID=3153640 RepID=A0ABV4YH67_9CYAN